MVHAEQTDARRRFAFFAEPKVAAGDRFQARAFRRLEELHQGEQVAGIGHRDGRQTQLRAAFHQRRQAQGGIGQRELAVQVQMNERGSHAGRRGQGTSLGAGVGPDKA